MPPGGSVAAMEVEVKDWSVSKAPNGLQIPAQGFYVAQLLSGVVTTDIKGKSETRKPGDFWTVDAGSPMTVALAPRKKIRAAPNAYAHFGSLTPGVLTLNGAEGPSVRKKHASATSRT